MNENEFESENQSEMEEGSKSPVQKAHGTNDSFLNIWLISYSDFMTILTIFFLAMYGYTYLDAASLLVPKTGNMTYNEFSEIVQKLKTDTGAELKVQDDVDKITIELSEKILFASGRAQLNSGADDTLKTLAESLNKVEGDVIVQGHSDNVPVRGGRFDSNWHLSAARAFSVIEKLTKYGVPEKRLAAWGFGENRPLVGNETVESRAQNRRIEIVVLKTKNK